jgi:hypothetical protein
MTTGVLARAALTGALYRRALHLTPAARLRLPNSAVLNHVSADVSRVDAAAQWFVSARFLLPSPKNKYPRLAIIRLFLLQNVKGTKTLTGLHTARSVDGAGTDDGLLDHPARRGANTIISCPPVSFLSSPLLTNIDHLNSSDPPPWQASRSSSSSSHSKNGSWGSSSGIGGRA